MPTDIVFGYTGKYFDDVTGLQNNWNRWYDPKQGRFISQDPIGFAGGDTNLYRYVGNDVTNASDPSGLYSRDFHYYVVYLMFRAKGWKPEYSHRVAGFSQYVDDNPETSPWDGYIHAATHRNFSNMSLMVNVHFWGSGPDKAVVRDPADLRARVTKAIASSTSNPEDLYLAAYAGIALHAYADTWAHEGFTPWQNNKINLRTGSYRPNRGHADTTEGGHYPDNPYNDIPRAIEAAKAVYDLIPEGPGNVTSWDRLQPALERGYKSGKYPNKEGLDPDSDQYYFMTELEKTSAMRGVSTDLWFLEKQEYHEKRMAVWRGSFITAVENWIQSCSTTP